MSLITYEGVSSSNTNPLLIALFLLPYLLRVTGGFLNKDPARGLCKRSYMQLAMLSLTTSLYSYFENYSTFAILLISIHIVLLTITSVNQIQVPHYLELFNTLSFFSVFFTPIPMWIGATIIWSMNTLNNLMCGKIIGIVLALLQIASGILAFTAANQLAIDEFYVMLAVSLSLMIGQLDLLRV